MTSRSIPRPPAADKPLSLLGGLTPQQFMRRHWQKKPLLIRGAIPGFEPLLSRARLCALAARADVESRRVARTADGSWTLEHGPFKKAALAASREGRWTLLVQGVDLHDEAVHGLLQSFRFVTDARLDDLMISWASEGGGVGPHVDSYDVFLLQAHGQRRWRIGRVKKPEFEAGEPLKILRHFVAEHEYVLGPGDMLYLPPSWGHEGVAESGGCMTYSIGFQAPRRDALAGELAARLLAESDIDPLYRDPASAATENPAAIPRALQSFALEALQRLGQRPRALERVLGELLTEPKTDVSFEPTAARWTPRAVVLDRGTRMMYDRHHVFINGESHRVTGRADVRLLRRLADERSLDAEAVRGASKSVRSLLREWFNDGWLRAQRA